MSVGKGRFLAAPVRIKQRHYEQSSAASSMQISDTVMHSNPLSFFFFFFKKFRRNSTQFIQIQLNYLYNFQYFNVFRPIELNFLLLY